MDSPQSWNRFSYVSNNPVRFNDPTGHMQESDGNSTKGSNCSGIFNKYCNKGKPKSKAELVAMRPKTQTPAGPMCAQMCTLVPPQTNPASYFPSANSYYWSTLAYGETAYYANNNLSLAKNGVNYGLSGKGIFGLGGRHYTPGTINGAITDSFTGLNAFGFSLATSLIGNVVDYGWGANANKGLGSQEFYVSTAVDTALTYTVGAVAAIGVGFFFTASAAPLAVIGLTALVATGAMIALDSYGVPNTLKQNTNALIDDLQGK